jgi:hypothetical protein
MHKVLESEIGLGSRLSAYNLVSVKASYAASKSLPTRTRGDSEKLISYESDEMDTTKDLWQCLGIVLSYIFHLVQGPSRLHVRHVNIYSRRH